MAMSKTRKDEFEQVGGVDDVDELGSLVQQPAAVATATQPLSPMQQERLRETQLQVLLRDVPCWACGHKGGKRVISHHVRKEDGALVRKAACKFANCGFPNAIVQQSDGKGGLLPPVLSPDADQDRARLPKGSPRAQEEERERIAKATATAMTDALREDLRAVLREEVRDALREATANGGGGDNSHGKKGGK